MNKPNWFEISIKARPELEWKPIAYFDGPTVMRILIAGASKSTIGLLQPSLIYDRSMDRLTCYSGSTVGVHSSFWKLSVTRLVSRWKKSIPEPAKDFVRSVRSLVRPVLDRSADLLDGATRKREMIPPRSMIFVGAGDYKSIGLEFLEIFKKYGRLKPEHRVLDVGCGTGRMAVPLTTYLSKEAEYEGFDVVEHGIAWANRNITPRYPNFHFVHADVRNMEYNPQGIYESATYKLPYNESSFDFIFLTSVFTHMFREDVENYLREICRVLKSGERCLITFFLMNEESISCIQKNASSLNFQYELRGCYTTTIENPEVAIAFDETYIRGLYEECGLSISEQIHYGSWCGRPEFLSYQDVVVARKV